MDVGIVFQCANFFPAAKKGGSKLAVSSKYDIFVEIFFPRSKFFLPVGALEESL